MHPTSSVPTDRAPWLKPAVEWGPLIAFFASYMAFGLLPATGVLIVTTAAAAAVSFAVERRVPWMPVFTAAIVGLFGGLTLLFNDETFIKLKPTVAQALMAAVLAVGALRNQLFLKLLMGKALAMSDEGWRILTWRFVGLLTVGALLNEAVWRTQSNDVWVAFKVFGLIGLTLVFMIAQTPLIRRHALPADDAGTDGGPHDTAR
jgi:intracellular septation protein